MGTRSATHSRSLRTIMVAPVGIGLRPEPYHTPGGMASEGSLRRSAERQVRRSLTDKGSGGNMLVLTGADGTLLVDAGVALSLLWRADQQIE